MPLCTLRHPYVNNEKYCLEFKEFCVYEHLLHPLKPLAKSGDIPDQYSEMLRLLLENKNQQHLFTWFRSTMDHLLAFVCNIRSSFFTFSNVLSCTVLFNNQAESSSYINCMIYSTVTLFSSH